jgi:hypothetical protein
MNALAHPDITIQDFEAANIEPDRFNHEAHVYMAWLYTREYSLSEALLRFDSAIKRLVSKLGAKEKYHTTITWFFLVLIRERFEANESWQEFQRRNADIISGSTDILARYYSDEHLHSDRARERFVLPDNLKLPV